MTTEQTKDEFASVRQMIGKHVKIVGKKHPWKGETGHITGWKRCVTGTPFCEVKLEHQNGITCAVFDGKDLKYI